jgi:hypothetical protein
MLGLMGLALLYMVFRPAPSSTARTNRRWTAKP